MNRHKIKDKHLVTCLVNFNPHAPDWKNDTKFIEVLKGANIPLNSHYTKQIVRHYKEMYTGQKVIGPIRGTYALLPEMDFLDNLLKNNKL